MLNLLQQQSCQLETEVLDLRRDLHTLLMLRAGTQMTRLTNSVGGPESRGWGSGG